MKKDFIVVLLGSDENVYGFARSLHKSYKLKPIALTTFILEPTKNSKIIDFIVDEKIHEQKYFEEKLIKLGNKLKKEYCKIILVPCSDFYMEMISIAKDKLSMYENEFIDYKTLKEFNNKETFYKMCDKYDLPYPKSYIINKKDYNKVVDKLDINYPLILKPNNSNSEDYLEAKFNNKEKVYFIKSKEELLETIKNVYSSTYKDNLIVQEFVNGDDTNNRVLNVYSDKNGKVKMMSLGAPILEEYHPKTYGNYAAIISNTEHIELMDKIKKFLESINYKGASNFDIKIDSKTKKYYVFEINPRPGRSSFVATCAGKGFMDCYIEDLIYDNLEENIGAKKEVLWLNVPMKLIKKYVTNKEILKKIKKIRRKGEVYHTLRYKKDASLARIKIWYIQYARKIHYFPKYYRKK